MDVVIESYGKMVGIEMTKEIVKKINEIKGPEIPEEIEYAKMISIVQILNMYVWP